MGMSRWWLICIQEYKSGITIDITEKTNLIMTVTN